MYKKKNLNHFLAKDFNIRIKKELLIYLDSSGILKDIRTAALKYKKVINTYMKEGIFIPPFRFCLKTDLLRILEISCKLYFLFVTEPKKTIKIAEELVYYALRELEELKNVSKWDIQIVIDLTSFSSIKTMSDHYFTSSQELIVLNGILVSYTAPYKYIRSRVYFCSSNNCPLSKGRRYEYVCNNTCSFCYSSIEEDVRSRDIGEEITAQIITPNAFKHFGCFQSITMKIKDEICTSTSFQIGDEYNAVGIFEDNIFNVYSISRKKSRFEILTVMGFLHSLQVPTSIAEFFHRVSEFYQNSPWSFVGAIASILASDIIPVSSFLQLKTGLVLSLATQNSEDPPVPVVAIGTDILAVQKLINAAGQLAERLINYSAGFSQLGGRKIQNCRNETRYEAGAMIFGANGVCNLGDWSKFKKEQTNYIFHTIESGQIMLVNKKNTKKETDFIPLKSAIWTYWCHITQSNTDQLQLKTLIDIFGIPFLAEENTALEAEKFSTKMLQIAKLGNKQFFHNLFIPSNDFKEFIALINSRHLLLNERATQLIRDFFVTIRKERPECLPLKAIKTITSLAEAHARLSLRNEIIYEDVVAVLYLYNYSISILFGSPLITSEISTSDNVEESPLFVHNNVEFFKISLEEYLSNNLSRS